MGSQHKSGKQQEKNGSLKLYVQIYNVIQMLGTPVVPFRPFYLGVSLLKLNSRKKGTLIINGLLGNLGPNP